MVSTRSTRGSWFEHVRDVANWVLSSKIQTKIWGAVLIALAVAWSTYWLGPRTSIQVETPLHWSVFQADPPNVHRVAPDEAIATRLAASRIRFPDWQQLIKTSADDANRRSLVENYRGETVTWEGYFDEVQELSAPFGGSETGRFLLSMYESEAVRTSTILGRAPALCVLSESARNQVADLKPGQRVVIQGTLAAPETMHGNLLGTRLYNCEILLR